jgi:hypothetical protein
MVGSEVVGWNPLLHSLVILAEKLEELGLVYHDSTASYIEVAEVARANISSSYTELHFCQRTYITNI